MQTNTLTESTATDSTREIDGLLRNYESETGYTRQEDPRKEIQSRCERCGRLKDTSTQTKVDANEDKTEGIQWRKRGSKRPVYFVSEIQKCISQSIVCNKH